MLSEFPDFKPYKTRPNVIQEHYDSSCRMHRITLNRKEVYLGNTWDFHNGCHGSELPAFQTPSGYCSALKTYLEAHNFRVTLLPTNKTWRYT